MNLNCPDIVISLLIDAIRLSPRTVHNVNVVGSYNVLRTSADNGIKRIVQASSVNATGLVFTHESRRKFEEFPLTELSPRVPEDAYSELFSR